MVKLLLSLLVPFVRNKRYYLSTTQTLMRLDDETLCKVEACCSDSLRPTIANIKRCRGLT